MRDEIPVLNPSELAMSEILWHCRMMAWNDLCSVRDQCRVVTRPVREAAQDKYKRRVEQ